MKVFIKKQLIDKNKTIAAYNYLAKKYHKEIYQDRIPGWDPNYTIIVDYLTKKCIVFHRIGTRPYELKIKLSLR